MSSAPSVDITANTKELRQLSIDKVIYAGFSAGGLTAYRAAKQDAVTLACLGLDPVDSGKLASFSFRKHDILNLKWNFQLSNPASDQLPLYDCNVFLAWAPIQFW